MFQPAQDTRDEANKAHGAVTLVGYLGAVSSDGYRRLYRDPAVELYVEVRVGDIVEDSSATRPPGQSRVWVRRDAGSSGTSRCPRRTSTRPHDGPARIQVAAPVRRAIQ